MLSHQSRRGHIESRMTSAPSYRLIRVALPLWMRRRTRGLMRSVARLVLMVSIVLASAAGAADAGARPTVLHAGAARGATAVHGARHAHRPRHAAPHATWSASRAGARPLAPASLPSRPGPHRHRATTPVRVRVPHRDPRPGTRDFVPSSAVRVERAPTTGTILTHWDIVEHGIATRPEAGRGPPRASPDPHSAARLPARATSTSAPTPSPLPDPLPTHRSNPSRTQAPARAPARPSLRAASFHRVRPRPRDGAARPGARLVRASAVRPGARRRTSTAPFGGTP
jgi:hypothetical protein